MREMQKKYETFLKELNKIGRSKSEIRAVRSKIQTYTGKLYRYRPLPNEKQLEKDEKLKEQIDFRTAELNGKLYIQTNKELNDPMDMTMIVKSTNYKMLIKAYKNNPKAFATELKEKKFTNREIKKILRTTSEKAYDYIRDKLTITFGNYAASHLDKIAYDFMSDAITQINHIYSFNRIACFTETYNNMPMWNSYANDYHGVCFEYNIEKADIIDKIYPVIYADDKPDMFDIFSMMQLHDKIPFISPEYQLKLLLFKTNDWSYEKEWRYIDTKYDKFDDFAEDFFDDFLEKLPPDEKEQIEEKLKNFVSENPNGSLLDGINKVFPPDFLEKFNQFVLQLPSQKSRNSDDDFEPCRIYLGHKILPEYEKYFKDLAKARGIEVLKMSLTPTGYQPVNIEEANKKKSQEILKQAEIYLDNSQYEDSIQACTESIEISPIAMAYVTRGRCYSRTERKDLALNDYKEAIKIEPSNPIAHNNAGSIYREIGKNDLSIEECSIALSEWIGCFGAYICLTITYIDECKYELAIETIKKGHKNCEDFAKKLCDNSDFTDALGKHPAFIKLIHEDSYFSEIIELISNIKNDE